MSSIRRLICKARQTREGGGGTAACGTLEDHGSLEKEKNISSVSSSMQTALSHQPVAVPPHPRSGHQTSTVTCQSRPDSRWPCAALLETIWIDLAFLICFRRWFPWQLACERGAMPNKIGLIGARISWFYGVGAWGAGSRNVQGFFYWVKSVVEALSRCAMFFDSYWPCQIMGLIQGSHTQHNIKPNSEPYLPHGAIRGGDHWPICQFVPIFQSAVSIPYYNFTAFQFRIIDSLQVLQLPPTVGRRCTLG